MISTFFKYADFFREFEKIFTGRTFRSRWMFGTGSNFFGYVNYCMSHRAAVKRIKNRRRK